MQDRAGDDASVAVRRLLVNIKGGCCHVTAYAGDVANASSHKPSVSE